MDPGGMLLEDFGQRVDLTRRIREVLANYPEGTTALRELIQNADDAGASRVRLCLDRRAHGASSLLAPAPVQWQGPALLAHNDAAFTDEDFASISRIGDSKKAWKIGRFRALKIKLTERNKDLEVFPVTAERVPGKEMNLGRAKLRTVAAANTPAAVAPVHQLASTWVRARKSSAPAHLHLGGGEEEPSNQRGDPGRGRAQHQRGDPGRGRGGDPGRGHAGAGAGGGGGGGRLRRWRIQN